ncbi:MAG TPA: hypothetical protein VF052_11530 [Solirubrobacterales bacterium]|jgi:hypothetical protein
MEMEAESTGGGAVELERITARLDELATELEGDVDDDRAAALVREASELASKAGRAVESAIHAGPAPEG